MNYLETITKLGFDESQFNALKSSIYPGAKDESILLVLHYCKAANLDPMMKPVHIVPMNVKDSKTGRYEWRDVVMPGIGLYRIQADRSRRYAGMSEPLYGPKIIENIGGIEIAYPEWCMITVRKIVSIEESNQDIEKESYIIAEFSAKEFWIENYATAGKDSTAPNAMWKRRIYGQLAKCTEAQGLRKAFPELGSQPTAEEMEGKTILEGDYELVPGSSGKVVVLDERLLKGEPLIDSVASNQQPMLEDKLPSDEVFEEIKNIIAQAKAPQDLNKALTLSKELSEELKQETKKQISDKRKELLGLGA